MQVPEAGWRQVSRTEHPPGASDDENQNPSAGSRSESRAPRGALTHETPDFFIATIQCTRAENGQNLARGRSRARGRPRRASQADRHARSKKKAPVHPFPTPNASSNFAD